MKKEVGTFGTADQENFEVFIKKVKLQFFEYTLYIRSTASTEQCLFDWTPSLDSDVALDNKLTAFIWGPDF